MANFYGRRRKIRREINPQQYENDTWNQNRSVGQRLASFKYMPDQLIDQNFNLAAHGRPLFIGACARCNVRMLHLWEIIKTQLPLPTHSDVFLNPCDASSNINYSII